MMEINSNTDLDDAVYEWYTQKISQGEPISDPILCEKAVQFNEKLGGPSNFQASTGWLEQFKSRHGIRELQIQGEKLFADSSSTDSLKFEEMDVPEEPNLALKNVYSAVETWLNWKALPLQTITEHRKLAALGHKRNRDRITILACANADGSHHLPMLVIGKSKMPRCFKHVNVSSMSIVYNSQKSARMDSKIFMEWFIETFIHSVKAHQLKNNKREKTLLLLRNTSTYPPCDILNKKDEFIKVMFIPSNEPLLLLSMHQGIIESFKQHYEEELRCKLLLNHKKIDLKDTFYMIEAAWGKVKQQNLKEAWKKFVCLMKNLKTGCVSENHDISGIIDLLKQLYLNEYDMEMDEPKDQCKVLALEKRCDEANHKRVSLLRQTKIEEFFKH